MKSWKIETAKTLEDCEELLKDETVRSLAENDYASNLRDCVSVQEFLNLLTRLRGAVCPSPDDETAGTGPANEGAQNAGRDSTVSED